MADAGLQVVAAQVRAELRGEFVGGGGLADGADVVALAFDGQERGAGDLRAIDGDAVMLEAAERQAHFLEHPGDGLEVEFLGQVEHGEVFVVEGLDALGLVLLAFDQVLVERLVLSTCRSGFIDMNAASCMKPG